MRVGKVCWLVVIVTIDVVATALFILFKGDMYT